MTTTLARVQLRRDTAANWVTADPTLSAGEIGVETDTLKTKAGDGTTAWTALEYIGALAPNGTRSAPNAVTAGAGIHILGRQREFQFVVGTPAAVVIAASPQIQAGVTLGQELVLQGTDGTKTVTLSNGLGLELNGACILRDGSRILLVWDGTVWGEVSRNDI